MAVCCFLSPGDSLKCLSVLGEKEALSSFLEHGCAQLAALCRKLTCTEV